MLYFLSGLSRSELSRDILTAKGLPVDLRAPEKLVRCDVKGKGPNGSSGVIVSLQPHTGYYPDRQTWHDFGDVWVGWESRPTPEGLQREHFVTGYPYELGDGQKWTCPILRAGRRINLPMVWGVNAAGQFAPRVIPAFEEELDLASWIFEVVLGDEECTTAQAWQTACRLLALNYNVCPRAITALGLITSSNYAAVFQAAIDGPGLADLCQEDLATVAALYEIHPEKKSTGDGSATTPGPTENLSTPPASES